MENEDEIQKKKNLLQREITDQNYDQTAFVNFCLSKKKNGDDLNEYTFDELKSVVKEFVALQHQQESEISKKKQLLQKEIIDKNYDQTAFLNFCISKKENGDDLNQYTYDELASVIKEFIALQQKQENEISKKKQLLEKEILGKKYDQTAFLNFCLSKKKNGDDLNEFTYEELESIIKEFIALQNPTKEEEKKEEDKQKPKAEHIEKIEKLSAEDDKNSNEKKINCKKLELTELNNKQINVIISNPTTVEGGVFGKSYIKYIITTQPFGWKVERRYSDFDALRKLIQKYYPSFYVPPLPQKKIGNKRFTESFIQKRMKFLNKFINIIVQNESFKASEVLHAFLSYTDKWKFESKLKEFQTRTPSSYVEEYRTLDGTITLTLGEKNEHYFENINKYFSVQDNIFDKLNISLKALNHNMKLVNQAIEEVQKNFEILYILNAKAMMKVNITKTYEEISNFFKDFGKTFSKQRILIKDHIKDFFKYVNLEGKAYSELIKRREDLKQKFKSENIRINAKKDKLYNNGDLSKMEINYQDYSIDKQRILKDKVYAFEHICYADTRELENLNNQLGYANKMNMRELKKLLKEYSVRFVNNVSNFENGLNLNTDDLKKICSNLENFVKSINSDVKK